MSLKMEDVELQSPFKCPNVPPRVRACSGSSASSTEREVQSPHHRHHHHHFHATVTTTSTTTAVLTSRCSRAGSEGSDENAPPEADGGADHLRVNPFERDILAGLEKSFCSPSLMDIKDTPPQRSWAIEHLSQLFPKDIENSPSTHQNSFPVDAQTEAKAQADIDTYFNRGPIVPTPSPMKERVIKVHTDLTRVKTVTDMHHHHSPVARARNGVGVSLGFGLGTSIKKLKKPVPAVERWTQTELSLPVDLPDYVERMLWNYSQNVDCGASGEAGCSQKSTNSDHGESGDSSEGKSTLNNSIRRRLELSFGEDPDGEDSQGLSQGAPTSPIDDPFRRNHVVSTPPGSSGCFQLNTTTSEIEVQLMRCEFTPETRGGTSGIMTGTPAITPIHDEVDEFKFFSRHPCSTPRRKNNLAPAVKDFITPASPSTQEPINILSTLSPSKSAPIESSCSTSSSSDSNAQGNNNNMLRRRSREDTPDRAQHRKRHSASSFDDSQVFTGDMSPPAKLHRRTSKDEEENVDGDQEMACS